VTATGIGQILVYGAALIILTPLLGGYMAKIYTRDDVAVVRWFGFCERGFLRLVGARARKEQDWKSYAKTVIVFSAVFFGLLYLILRLQGHLFLNPDGLESVSPTVAFNTAASFVTNTNWQYYGGETTMSYLSQMAGLAVQNFVSAGVGMAVLAAVVRGLSRRSTSSLGNFWVDLYRSIAYVLLPLSIVLALILVGQGVVQTFDGHATVTTLEGAQQSIARGPAASQIAIKQLGTNGGGFYNSNSAVPFENPTGLSNFLEMLSLLLIPAASTSMFGKMAGSVRQGWAIFAAMFAMFAVGVAIALPAEQHGSQVLRDSGVSLAIEDGSSGGNMSDKEVRFGIADTALWATATTDASNGSVNGGHDALTAAGGAVPIVNMFVGEVVFGGAGSGMYGMLLYVLLAVFVSGLMVGRTPEYLGKKIEAREVKIVLLGVLFPMAMVLVMTALAVTLPAGLASVFNPGPHGFSEALYAYTSQGNNNGSAFAGYGATTFSTLLGGTPCSSLASSRSWPRSRSPARSRRRGRRPSPRGRSAPTARRSRSSSSASS
jgi:K+-transporting ATPase ATPase A chain